MLLDAVDGGDAALTLTIENDLVTGSDNNYTNGLGVTWVSRDLDTYEPDSFVRKWARLWTFLPFVGDEGYDTYASWSLAQEMHTPDDITDPNPPENDQPYAGMLYVDSLLYARKEPPRDEADRKAPPGPPVLKGETLTTHRGRTTTKERGSHTRSKKNPGKRPHKGG